MFSVKGQDPGVYVHKINTNENGAEFSIDENGAILINYSIPEILFQNLKNVQGSFYRISIPEHIATIDTGLPELPVLSKLLIVPEGSEIKVKISDVKSIRLRPPGRKVKGVLFPAQEGEAKSPQARQRSFAINNGVYKKRKLISSDTVNIEILGKSRNNNLVNIYIQPARYNPGRNLLEIITSMKIEVSFSGDFTGSKSIGSPLFDISLSKGVINPATNLINDYSEVPVGMVILTDTMFTKTLQPFIEWKTRKGFRIKVLNRGDKYAGTTYTELRDTLKAIYESSTEEQPAPDYLLIVGDINKIPKYSTSSGNATDLYYGEYDGNGDFLPEIYTGRLPVKDTAELRNVVNKIIQYEKFEFADTNKFYSNALATTGYDFAHKTHMNGQIRYSITNYLTDQNKIKEFHYYHTNEIDEKLVAPIMASQKAYIIDSLFNKKGLSFINYTGHGGTTGWKNLNILVDDITTLKNNNMYPFIVSNACETGQFHIENSFSNRMLLEKNKGAIGVIGCSNDSYWDEDYFYSVGLGQITEYPSYSGKGPGFFDSFFHTHDESPSEWYYTIGQINYAGNLSVSSSTSFRKKYYWETYNIVGDPSMIPILGKPGNFDIILPDTLPVGIRKLTLNATPFAYAAISDFDTLWDASFASPSGSVILDIPQTSDDSCLVVITGQNKYPIIKTVFFSDLSTEFLNLDTCIVSDPNGNKDGKVDYEENFNLSFLLNNLGSKAADSVYVKVSSTSEWLSVITDSTYIGTISPGSKINVADKLSLRVTGKVPDLQRASVNLVICSTENTNVIPVDVLIHSPILKISAIITNDTESGNGDFIADAGENID
ncbi:MAG TPA: C25 family cysteine peptidase, partial [Bacteroidales bacterium]|nr:C25 family cysteine peptidase [Bacteroidales bacterium]